MENSETPELPTRSIPIPPPVESRNYIEQLLVRVNLHIAHTVLPPDVLSRFPIFAQLITKEPKVDLRPVDLQDPELQQSLSYVVQYTPTKWLLEQEKEFIIKRRKLHLPKFADTPDPDIYDWARKNQVTGLCFSGGGIRSATFNLGILQGMVMQGWLPRFDYLSSVSGGGYIHSWLAAWLLRKSKEDAQLNKPQPPQSAWDHVMRRLYPLATGDREHNQFVWPRQIQWLRRYSNYLTPRKGLMTGDTWAAFATWLRNVLLNQSLLLSMFLLVLCVPHLLAPTSRLTPLIVSGSTRNSTRSTVTNPQAEATLTLQLKDTTATAARDTGHSNYGAYFDSYLVPREPLPGWRQLWRMRPRHREAVLALIFYLTGCFFIGRLLRLEYNGARPGSAEDAFPPRRSNDPRAIARRQEFWIVCFGVVMPLFCFGFALTRMVVVHPASPLFALKIFAILLVLVWIETFCGGALSNTMAQKEDKRKASYGDEAVRPRLAEKIIASAGLLVLGIPAAITGTLLAVAIAALLRSPWMGDAQHWLLRSDLWSVQLTLGTLLFFWLPPLTMVVASGLIGKQFPGWLGEWLARIRGYTLITGIGWICLSGGALLLPGVASRLASYHWIGWPSVGTWILATAAGVLSGKSGKTTGDQHTSSGTLNAIALVAPYVYIIGLLVLLSWLIDLSQNHGWPAGHAGWLWAIGVLAGVAALLGWRLDINQFSMHTFYRNRLTRCYLGASNSVRNPSPVTGFDEHDSSDLCVHHLTPDHYPGPIPIFSCAMNITTGEDLAWQERKAASFAFTPYYSGYTVGWTSWQPGLKFNGFVPTSMLYPGGPTVATAMAASGAAISPNWGYHTNPATAFLLTMFDARLGLWVPNPRRSQVAGCREAKAKVPPASPRLSLVSLISELLGSVNDSSPYVYVTDGGHFDNSGLYELVRRRCYNIVICDAEEDGSYQFEGIGAAIRKCRIDFGAEIELDLSALVPNTTTRLSPEHVAQGSIRYPETPGDEHRGTITYIKSSLASDVSTPGEPSPEGAVTLPDVPGDVQAYKRQHADFPHDSTAEQWFTESQFESYRRLGQRIVESMTKQG